MSKMRFLIIVCTVLAVIPRVSAAQGGPPEFVRTSLDNIVAMLRAEDEASITTFIENDLTSDAYTDKADMATYLRTVRKSVANVLDDIGLEFDGEMHTIILRSGRQSRAIEFDPTPNGIRTFRLLDPTETPVESPRDRALRDHVSAFESATESTLEAYIQNIEREHLAPSMMSSMPESERRRILSEIYEAARSSSSIGLNEEGETLIMMFDSATVTFEIESGLSARITSLSVRKS